MNTKKNVPYKVTMILLVLAIASYDTNKCINCGTCAKNVK